MNTEPICPSLRHSHRAFVTLAVVHRALASAMLARFAWLSLVARAAVGEPDRPLVTFCLLVLANGAVLWRLLPAAEAYDRVLRMKEDR